MWLPDPLALRCGALALGLLVAASVLPGCTVRPLYARNDMAGTGLNGGAANAAGLSDIGVAPVTSLDALAVRNQLIFLLNGGGGQPVNPRYTVRLNILTIAQAAASIQIATDERATAAQVVMTSRYIVIDNQTGKPVATGRREMVSSYDVPRQEFAALRARRDAENRAARELAELLRLALAQDLALLAKTPVALK